MCAQSGVRARRHANSLHHAHIQYCRSLSPRAMFAFSRDDKSKQQVTVQLITMPSSTLFDALLSGIGYGVSMFGAGFVFGAFRVLLLAPSLGELVAVFIELPIIMIICWNLSKLFVEKVVEAGSGVTMGIFAFVTLLLLEVGLALFVFDRTWDETLQDFASLKGRIGLAGQLISSLFPLWHLRMKPKQRQE